MNKTRIRWVGTGGGLNPVLGNTSFTVAGQGAHLLLVDCGATVPLKLIQWGELSNITDIVITHLHADHVGGLETIGFYNYFVAKKRGADMTTLHLPTETMAHALWEHSLKGGMGVIQEKSGESRPAALETYFNVSVGTTVRLPGLPGLELFATPHVHNMENFGVRLDNGVFYSGDTTLPPPGDPSIIFQDCQFGPTVAGDVHITYESLLKALDEDVRQKTYLVHLGVGYKDFDPKEDGFAGFVLPEQTFEI